MKLSFAQLIEELQERSSDELYEFEEIARRRTIEQRKKDIAEKNQNSEVEWQPGKYLTPEDYVKLKRLVAEGRISPRIASWVGILPPDTDVDVARLEYQTQKHMRDWNND